MSVVGLPDQELVQGLQPFQGWLNGLTFGENTNWILEGTINGLLQYEGRLGDRPIPQGDGDIPFNRYAAGKTVVWPFRILGDSELDARVEVWEDAFEATDPQAIRWMAFKTTERLLLIRVRVSRRDVEMAPVGARTRTARAVVEVKQADPRIYDGSAWVQTTFIPLGAGTTGGFDLPTDLPLDMEASDPAASIVENTGRGLAYPLLRIANPSGAGSAVTQAVVTNVTTGDVFTINTTIAEGQTLTADFGAIVRAEPAPHVHIGGASRYGSWEHPRVPLFLAKGDNILTADHTGGAPVFRLDWLPADL